MSYRKILLIDDDLDDQEIFLSAVSRVSEQIECSTFTNAKEALDRLAAKDLRPELIFLDLNMPIMSGQEFLQEVKQTALIDGIPIVILSTSSNVETIQYTKRIGASDFITKPDRFDTLVNILTPILSNKT